MEICIGEQKDSIVSPAAEGHEKNGGDDERGSARGDGAIEDKRPLTNWEQSGNGILDVSPADGTGEW